MPALNLTLLEAKVILIKSSDYKNSLWKNGQGRTDQIAIEPKDAVLTNEDFLWRLSSAEIQSNTNFSVFKNYDRLLTVLTGKGLILNDQSLLPLNVVQFSGDSETECRLVQDPVVDLGLIYNRDHVAAKMTIKTFSANDDRHQLKLSEGVHFLFCVNGSFKVRSFTVNANDTLHVEGPFESEVFLQKPATYVHIKICSIENKPAFCKLATHV